MIDERGKQALDLRRAGIPFDVIATRLGFDSVADARVAFEAALDAADPDFENKLEADRLDRLLAAVWPKAARGELDAVDRALKISERRDRLSPTRRRKGELRKAFDESVGNSKAEAVDSAIVEAGRTIADRVDAAVALGEGQEVTKALYLIPHMVNILRELLATPASRVQPETPAPTGNDRGKLALLREAQRQARRPA